MPHPSTPLTFFYMSKLDSYSMQETHLDQILLNGNNIAMLVPGGRPEDNQ